MAWEIEWSPKALKRLKSLPRNLQERIVKRVGKLKDNPFHFLEHFEGMLYKLQIGDYRALVDIDFENKIIMIQVFDHRGRIYERI